jgi:hypothetical protein
MMPQTDTWWQLQSRRSDVAEPPDMLHDEFTHTVVGCIGPNHEWLSQVLFYALFRAGGRRLDRVLRPNGGRGLFITLG